MDWIRWIAFLAWAQLGSKPLAGVVAACAAANTNTINTNTTLFFPLIINTGSGISWMVSPILLNTLVGTFPIWDTAQKHKNKKRRKH